MKVRQSDSVRILAENLPAALVEVLGNGRDAIYSGQVIAVNGDRVNVKLHDGRQMWFDADVLTTNFTMALL